MSESDGHEIEDLPFLKPWEYRDGMPVKITGGTGPYNWTLQSVLGDGTTADDPRGIGDTGTLYDLNGASHTADEVVWAKRSPVPDAGGKAVWLIVAGGGGGAGIPAGTRAAQVLTWTTDEGPAAWQFVQWTGVI